MRRYSRIYSKTEKSKISRSIYHKALLKLKNLHQDEFNKIREDLE